MINFSGLSNNWVGNKLRNLFAKVPGHTYFPVCQGEAAGMWWHVKGSNHSCWLGNYEMDKQKMFAKYCKIDMVVYDIGAHAGFYSLIAARKVGNNGKVLAVEPYSKNVEIIRRNIQRNRKNNIQVICAAVSDKNEMVRFDVANRDSYTGRVSENGSIEIAAITLDDMAEKYGQPHLIKIDVEGGETKVLLGASKTLMRSKPVIFLAVHSVEQSHNCASILQDAGYKVQALAGMKDEWLALDRELI